MEFTELELLIVENALNSKLNNVNNNIENASKRYKDNVSCGMHISILNTEKSSIVALMTRHNMEIPSE